MKHTDALIALIARINDELGINEKQLLAAREKVAKLQQRESDLKQQLGRARYAGHLKGDSCPECYVTSGKDQPLSSRSSDNGNRLTCPACHWTHEAGASCSNNDKWILKLESPSGVGFQTVEI